MCLSNASTAVCCGGVLAGLPSDHALPDDPECLKFIQAYADDQQLFFKDFAAAYLQLTAMGAVWA
jgi:L-ascorbate peroxidase